MQIKNFKTLFTRDILARGQSYYEHGHVLEVVQINDTNWQAEVQGTALYIVDFTLDRSGNITYIDCDCPYESNCKHMVAALYTFSEVPLHAKQANAKKPALKELLEQQSKQQLIDYIMAFAKKHRTFRDELELQLLPVGHTLQAAENIIDHYIDAAEDRHGFIPWSKTSLAVQGIERVHEQIQEHLHQDHFVHAAELALLCLHKALELMTYGDDSSGEFSGAAENSIDYLFAITESAEEIIHPADSQMILESIQAALYEPDIQDYPDWQSNLLFACLPLCHEEAIQQQFLQMLDSFERLHPSTSIQDIRSELTKQKLTPEDLEQYLQQHPEDHTLRKQLLQAALQQKNYEKVLALAEAAPQQNGWQDWRTYAFTAHRELGHLKQARALAEELLLKGESYYYEELRDLYTKAEWPDKREALLNRLEKKGRYLYEQLIAQDDLKERLLAFCQRHTDRIQHHYGQLHRAYPQEVAAIFTEEVTKRAASATNRSQYESVCRLLQTMQKAGYKEQVAELVAQFKLQYKRRPAFVDELGKV